MRKSPVLASAFAIASIPALLNAQPVIRRADLAPVGHSTTMNSTAGTVSPGAGGPNQTWDFSGPAQTAAGTVTVADPATSPTAASHPTANYAWKLDLIGVGTGYSYQKVDDVKFESIADGVTPLYAGKVYTNPITTLVFPFAFGDSAADTYQYSGIAENPVTLIYDGYGTVKLPGGDVTNCVRVRMRFSGGSDFTWYRTAPVFPLAVYSYNGQKLTVFSPAPTALRSATPNDAGFKLIAGRGEVRIRFAGPVPADARLILSRIDGTTREYGMDPAGGILSGLASGVACYRLVSGGATLATGSAVIE